MEARQAPPKPTAGKRRWPGAVAPDSRGVEVAKSKKATSSVSGTKAAAERYFRVYDSRGRVLVDILPLARAKRFRRKWNRDAGRLGIPPCHLVRLDVREIWQ